MSDPFEDPFDQDGDSRKSYQRSLEEALERAQKEGDADEEARVLLDLGCCHQDALQYEKAAECFELGLQHLKSTEQYALSIPALFRLARIEQVLKKPERSFNLYHQIIEVSEKIGNHHTRSLGLVAKGQILIDQKSHRNGLELIFRGLHILEDLKLPERKEVLDWLKQFKETIPHEAFDLAIHQSSVSPRIKDLLKST